METGRRAFQTECEFQTQGQHKRNNIVAALASNKPPITCHTELRGKRRKTNVFGEFTLSTIAHDICHWNKKLGNGCKSTFTAALTLTLTLCYRPLWPCHKTIRRGSPDVCAGEVYASKLLPTPCRVPLIFSALAPKRHLHHASLAVCERKGIEYCLSLHHSDFVGGVV